MPVKKTKAAPKKQEIESITLAEFVTSVAKSQGVTKVEVYNAIQLFKAGVTETLKQNKAVQFNELASFGLRYSEERTGHNPQTGAKLKIPARYRVVIKPSNKLNDFFKPKKPNKK